MTTKQDLEQTTVPTLIDFYADWCGPCQVMMPTIEKLKHYYDGKLNIQKVNIDEGSELAKEFGVRSIPTLVLAANGKFDVKVGLQSSEALINWINSKI